MEPTRVRLTIPDTVDPTALMGPADTHLRRIYSKCGVHSRQELLDLAEKTAASLRSRE